MQAEVPAALPLPPSSPTPDPAAINEQILRLMQSLGIDPARTKEVRISSKNLYVMNLFYYYCTI